MFNRRREALENYNMDRMYEQQEMMHYTPSHMRPYHEDESEEPLGPVVYEENDTIPTHKKFSLKGITKFLMKIVAVIFAGVFLYSASRFFKFARGWLVEKYNPDNVIILEHRRNAYENWPRK
ncbi:uncharacterized protein NEMAJ01_0077 [Nematocida major]|uniref:uncharacterized protein n=1 Tax=Nematocida major TaxID=1912982 RepID=UPI0020081A7D|nr:uncharacterized protein NEMAJ01_0077 [Nematocida major]KAH9385181.1 hypothetical protein NEMAJ01_0077 [Nematocida major]